MKITHIDVHEAHKRLEADKDITILDVRTPDEFELFYIKGAVNIDASGKYFAYELKDLDKDKPYLVHCHSGERSLKALDVLRAEGFKNILHMDGGMREWNHEKLPAVYNWTI